MYSSNIIFIVHYYYTYIHIYKVLYKLQDQITLLEKNHELT